MVDFIMEVIFPLAIALILMSVIYRLISLFLETIHLDIILVKIAVLLVVYYFAGPYLLDLVEGPIFPYINPIVKLFYIPVQTLIQFFA